MPENPNYEKNIARTAERSIDRSAELERIEREAIANFKGQFTELTSSIGMLRLGDHVGWKVLAIIHSKATIRKYEKTLGIQIKTFFPEEGPSAERSMGYTVAKKLTNFWKAVSGDIKIKNKQEISED